jgi:serine/threonine-protein kinase
VADDGTPVALKFLPCSDALTAAKEIRSIQIVRHLHHPNLIPIHQVSCHRGYVIVTMELADGSLMDMMEAHQQEYQKPLSPRQVCAYLEKVADVLDYMNRRRHHIDGQLVGIQHCDVKPSNLLLVGDTVKLSDFSLSSITGSPVKPHRRAGTLGYAAPEVFQGRLSDWTDQFALAITYCELRSLKLPFKETPKGFSKSVSRDDPDLNFLPLEEQLIVARALSQAPHKRWPSCTELMRQLRKVIGRRGE